MKIKFVDLGFKEAATLLALCVAALTILLAYSMAVHAMPAIHKFGLRFLVTSTWDPVKEMPEAEG